MSGLHLHTEVETTWPGDGHWAALSDELRRFLDEDLPAELELRPDRTVWSVEDGSPTGFALERGDHLQPGALYTSAWPQVRVATAAIGLGGSSGRRTVHAQFRHSGVSGRATLDLDALDDPRSLRTEGDLRYVSWNLEALRDPDRLLRGKLRLRWLAGGIEARVRRTEGGRTVLAVDLGVYGRGVWSAPVNLALKAARRFLEPGLHEAVAEAAQALGEFATSDHDAQALLHRQEMRRRNTEEALRLIRRREAAFWAAGPPKMRFFTGERRWKRRWMEHYDALGPVRWPACHLPDQEWADIERDLYAQNLPWQRGPADQTLVQTRFEALHGLAAHQDLGLTPPPSSDPDWPARLTDATFDLAWLRSPWRILRHARALEAQYDAQLTPHR